MPAGLSEKQWYNRAYRWIRKKNNPFVKIATEVFGKKPKIKGVKASWDVCGERVELYLNMYNSWGHVVLYPYMICRGHHYEVLWNGFRRLMVVPDVAYEEFRNILEMFVKRICGGEK